jgi:hypothetical protein
MQVFVVFAAVVAVAAAQGYGVPSQQPSQPIGGGYQQEQQHTPQVFKHVYVHVAPDEQADEQSRVIRVPGGDKHVNIIFVKTPSSSSSQQTEVILPEQDEHKNLVYVLLKKGEASSDVKIRRPAAPRQQKPDVYFIRYKDQAAAAAPQQPSYGAPAAPAPVRTPSTQYGAF